VTIVFEDQDLADKAVVAVEKTIHYDDGEKQGHEPGAHIERVTELPLTIDKEKN
jgi:hypothetical protein